jgi:hypothetical protein
MIEHYEFGSYIINGVRYRYDIKLYMDHVEEWGGRDGHQIRLADIHDLVTFGPQVIIIGTGAYNRIRVDPEVDEELKRAHIKLFKLPTPQAVKKYNE